MDERIKFIPVSFCKLLKAPAVRMLKKTIEWHAIPTMILCYQFMTPSGNVLSDGTNSWYNLHVSEIAAFGASNDVSCVVIVSKSLQQYCFVDISKFGKNQVVSEQGNWAKCAFDRYPGKPHFNICFSEVNNSTIWGYLPQFKRQTKYAISWMCLIFRILLHYSARWLARF